MKKHPYSTFVVCLCEKGTTNTENITIQDFAGSFVKSTWFKMFLDGKPITECLQEYIERSLQADLNGLSIPQLVNAVLTEIYNNH